MGFQPLKKQRKKKYKPTNSKQSIFLICAFVADHRDMQILQHLGSLVPILYCGRRGRGSTRGLLGECFKVCSDPYYVKSFSGHLNSANSRQPRLFSLSSSYAVVLEPCAWDF